MRGWLDLATANQPAHQLDERFYEELKERRRSLRPAREVTVLPGAASALRVDAGQTFRVIEVQGPQIGTVALWNAHDPAESFNGPRTMAAIACFIEPYVQLWSDVPRFRPLATCIEDTVRTNPDAEFHHHCIGSPCSTETMERRFGVAGLDSCQAQLERAIGSFGVAATDVFDIVSVHQKTRLDPLTGKISVAPSDAEEADYIEFYAEIDLIVGVAVCPLGDGSADPRQVDPAQTRPLRVEVHETGTDPKRAPVWADWRHSWTGRWQPPADEHIGQ